MNVSDKGSDEARCPVCGQGILSELGTESGSAIQDANARVTESYSCGHQVGGPALETADAGSLEVERRDSEDTVPPIELTG